MDGDFTIAFAVLGLIQVVGAMVAALSAFFLSPMETGQQQTQVIRSVGPSSATYVVTSSQPIIHTIS